MDLLKKADQTFRVVLRHFNRIAGSTMTEPEFNIQNNYQYNNVCGNKPLASWQAN